MGKLDGKVALITGGTSGIGESIARLFYAQGAMVAVIGRDAERGSNIVNSLRNKRIKDDNIDISDSRGGYFFQCDVSDEDSVKNLLKNIESTYDHLDILVNCAGVLITAPLEEITIENWHKCFAVNTDSVMLMSKNFFPLLKKSKGCVLNIASEAGLQSHIKGRASYMYASSKAATIQFSQFCALNYSDSIRVNCLCPGVTVTPIFKNRDFSRFSYANLMHRMAAPEEIAQTALFLCSDDSSFITGAVLTCDGGGSLI